MLHKAYHKQLRPLVVSIGVGVVVLLSSFAIYLGRELRWNSWDIVLHPVEVLSEAMMIINPFTHSAAAWMTLSFFMMISTFYLVLWWGAKSIAKKE